MVNIYDCRRVTLGARRCDWRLATGWFGFLWMIQIYRDNVAASALMRIPSCESFSRGNSSIAQAYSSSSRLAMFTSERPKFINHL